jgi:hypothetical protein
MGSLLYLYLQVESVLNKNNYEYLIPLMHGSIGTVFYQTFGIERPFFKEQ